MRAFSRSLLLASAAALLLWGTGTIVQAQGGNAPPTGHIQANRQEPSTFFHANMTDPEGDSMTFAWELNQSCGGVLQAGPPFGHPENGAEWKHGNDTGCAHPGDATNHRGTVSVEVFDGTSTVGCEYEGSATGVGQDCELISSSPSPSPSHTFRASCEVQRDRYGVLEFVVYGTFEGETIEIRPRAGSNLELEVVINGVVVCTEFLSDFTRLVVFAGGGDDTILVSDQLTKETDLSGSRGNDTIVGGSGRNVIDGDVGNDNLTGGSSSDHIVDLEGDNTVDGRGGEDHIRTSSGNDTIKGGGGPDTIKGGAGANQVEGGKGNDSILEEIDEVKVICRVPAQSSCPGDNHDIFNGGPGNDRIIAGGGNDTVLGAGGDDFLRGGKHNDVLRGGDGSDDMDGEDGKDRLDGGGGNDDLKGGAGSGDRCDGGPGRDRIYTSCESYS